MKNGRGLRPSAGFIFLVVIWLLMTGFFVWGFAEPDLDRVWWVEQRHRQGDFESLSNDDKAAMQRSLERHPELAETLRKQGLGDQL